MAKLDVDDFIHRLLDVGSLGGSLTRNVPETDLTALCAAAREVFLSQPALIEIESPVKVCGDTHGQYFDVLRLFDRAASRKAAITCSWGTTWTAAGRILKPFVCCSRIRSSTPRTSSCSRQPRVQRHQPRLRLLRGVQPA